MGDLKPLLEPATDADVDTLLARLTAARAGFLDNVDNANLATIDDISSLTATEIARLDADISSRAPSSEYDTEMARITADVATEAKQDIIDGIVDDILADTDELQTDWVNGGRLDLLIDAIKDKTDDLPSHANTDKSGSLVWSVLYGILETDISTLFSTDLTGTTRRKYSVFIDLTNAEADDAFWTKCTVRVKVGFGAVDAYRTVDLKEITKVAVAAAKEPGIPIDVPAVAKNVQITLQFDVALERDATIYYTYVNEALE